MVPTTGAIRAISPATFDTAVAITVGEVSPSSWPAFGNSATAAAMKVVIRPMVWGDLYQGIAAAIILFLLRFFALGEARFPDFFYEFFHLAIHRRVNRAQFTPVSSRDKAINHHAQQCGAGCDDLGYLPAAHLWNSTPPNDSTATATQISRILNTRRIGLGLVCDKIAQMADPMINTSTKIDKAVMGTPYRMSAASSS